MIMQDPVSFFCPISFMIMQDPVCTSDGHTYERSHIENWLRGNDSSPATGAVLSHKNLSPNIALRQAIEEWQEKQHSTQVKRADIQLEEPPVASGSFKTVYKGWLKKGDTKSPVAAMKLRGGSCATEAQMFLKLGRHPRLVRFMGHCIAGESELLLTELAPLGSLSGSFETLERKITVTHAIVMMHQVGS
jgi:hypothetical protein